MAARSVLSLQKVLPWVKTCGVRRRQLVRGSVHACVPACTCVGVQARVRTCVSCAGDFCLHDYSQRLYLSGPSKLEATETFFSR